MSTEPFVTTLDPHDVPESTRKIFEAFLRTRGKVPNLFRVAGHRPPIAEAFSVVLDATMGPGEVAPLLKELLTIRVSRVNGCEY